jgi:transcriptional regulator GlxA family with amidase domain
MDLRFRVGVTDDKLLKTLKSMEAHIETPLRRERLAKLAGVSLRQLERLFRMHLGRGLHQHYMVVRLGRSQQLLRESSLSILEIALATGFASASQFSRAFKRSFGSPPRAARQRHRSVLPPHANH